jgi:hypothetical protein
VTVHEPARRDGTAGDASLSPAQEALLADFSAKAGRPELNRPFAVVGAPPQRSLARKDITINTAISDSDLLSLASAGYLDYRAQDRTVAFCDKAYARDVHTASMPDRHVGGDGVAFAGIKVLFGKYRAITVVRVLFVAGAVALALLYAAGVLTSAAAQTWGTIAALLVASLALQAAQRERR